MAASPLARDEGLDDRALDEAIEYTRGRESGWRVAGVAVAIFLLLVAVTGSAMWLSGHRQAARVPAAAPAPVVHEPAAAVPLPAAAEPQPALPEPAGQARSEPPRSETTGLALPEPSTESVAASAARRASGSDPHRRPTVPSESPAASPHATSPRVEVSEVRVEIAKERLPDGVTRYSVRLRERDGTPARNVAVTVRGRRADGAIVEAPLDPTPEPGMYRAALGLVEISDPRLRVARAGRIKDLPLPE
ncbi:MAG TPA: hypothetical protein VFV05_23905 [Methylomirabilota bacterium]|nr:hypothetical protein [Methylomirabilota bacterium]